MFYVVCFQIRKNTPQRYLWDVEHELTPLETVVSFVEEISGTSIQAISRPRANRPRVDPENPSRSKRMKKKSKSRNFQPGSLNRYRVVFSMTPTTMLY